jgi:ABC-type polysaccharide/polyol phosphate transport system ATPase subunit
MAIAISFENVSKKFYLNPLRPRSWQESLLRLFSREPEGERGNRESFWVLKDLNFEVYQGETVSLIGANGVGKSTLLKLITHIIKPTYGTIQITGRVSALLELGTGFHPDLTGRENIYLGGTLAGLSRSEINKNISEIIDFADIGRFIDVPVRHYSSGMFVRLGFALATHIDPNILIADEVLAVGDESFQKKCLEKIQQIRSRGATVLLVSHSMNVIRSISDRVIWMGEGTIQHIGKPDDVIQAYLTDQKKIYNAGYGSQKGYSQVGKPIKIESVEFFNGHGHNISILETGQKATIRINYLAHERVERPIFGLAIYSSDGTRVNGPNTDTAGLVIDWVEGCGAVEYQVSFLPLLGGTYELTIGVFDHTHTITYDYHDRAFSFTVKQENCKEMYGLVYMPANWRQIQNNH